MILTGKEYLESIRDGRVVYVGGERISDTTTHPAFANAARTYARLYDLKADPANRDTMTFEEHGERYSAYYKQPRSKDDLRFRLRAHEFIADFGLGLLGRTPDAVAGNFTGLTMKPEVFNVEGGFRDNVLSIYQHLRKNDIFATYAVVPPQGARSKEFYQAESRQPALRVTAEDDRGVTLCGMKMLATGAAYAHEVLIGNVMPIAADQKKEAITCMIPLNSQGLSLWARPPLHRTGRDEFDAPISHRFDESDCMLVFKDVHVPWSRVIVHDNPDLSRNIYQHTPAHVIGNHQCTVRFASKLRTLLGVASLIAKTNSARDIPAVRDTLGRLAAMEAGFRAMVWGQIEGAEEVGDGYWMPNRRALYGAIHWAMENHSMLIDTVRELMGGGHFQFPASVDILDNPDLADTFRDWWSSGGVDAVDRMKLVRFAWDLIGSDHASRATSYEKFFVGPAFAVRNYNFVYAPWDAFHAVPQRFMDTYGLPSSQAAQAAATQRSR